MKNKTIAGLIAVLVIASGVMFSGCIEEDDPVVQKAEPYISKIVKSSQSPPFIFIVSEGDCINPLLLGSL